MHVCIWVCKSHVEDTVDTGMSSSIVSLLNILRQCISMSLGLGGSSKPAGQFRIHLFLSPRAKTVNAPRFLHKFLGCEQRFSFFYNELFPQFSGAFQSGDSCLYFFVWSFVTEHSSYTSSLGLYFRYFAHKAGVLCLLLFICKVLTTQVKVWFMDRVWCLMEKPSWTLAIFLPGISLLSLFQICCYLGSLVYWEKVLSYPDNLVYLAFVF